MRHSIIAVFALLLAGCTAAPTQHDTVPAGYLDASGRDDFMSGGVKMIPIETPKGTFRVWTKRVGNHPTIKVLLLHGGPGFDHEMFQIFESYFPAAGIEYYYYDQLGSFMSDKPADPSLWDLPRFVEEVEQVRTALGLDSSNFYLLGQSWGGLLAMEYALNYQDHLKGLIISNMMASIPAYNAYADSVFKAEMDPAVLAQLRAFEAAKDYHNPRYMELLMEHHYVKHILRMPVDQWPDAVNLSFEHMNPDVYIPMQGPSELGASGKLANWDRTADLHEIHVPTLVIGATYDTMDPRHMEWISKEVQHGRFLLCPNGSHLAEYDDRDTYFPGVIRFLHDVDGGKFQARSG